MRQFASSYRPGYRSGPRRDTAGTSEGWSHSGTAFAILSSVDGPPITVTPALWGMPSLLSADSRRTGDCTLGAAIGSPAEAPLRLLELPLSAGPLGSRGGGEGRGGAEWGLIFLAGPLAVAVAVEAWAPSCHALISSSS